MPDHITLTIRKQLEIFMNPQRQRLLKTMEIEAVPITAKQLSELMGISPSSVTHHMRKLEQLGLITLDHTESIHGIQARYYKRLPVTVNLGGNKDDNLKEERKLISDYAMSETWKAFQENLENQKGKNSFINTGDAMTGVIHLTDEEALKFRDMIAAFQTGHMEPREGTSAWELSLITFPYQKAFSKSRDHQED